MTAAMDTLPVDTRARMVTRAQSGDAAALAALYESCFDRIYRYVLVRTGDAAEAEEITEEAFCRVLRSSVPFRASWLSPGPTSSLFEIARDLVGGRLRPEQCRGTILSLLKARLAAVESNRPPSGSPRHP